MIKWKFKDKSEQITRTSLKAKAIIGVVLCVMLISIFVVDDWQQKKDLQYYNMVIVLWNRGSMRKQ